MNLDIAFGLGLEHHLTLGSNCKTYDCQKMLTDDLINSIIHTYTAIVRCYTKKEYMSKYPYKQTQVKFSYKTFENGRFVHNEIDTARNTVNWYVPSDKGYVYNDFGYERVQEVKAKYEYLLATQSQAIIEQLQESLEEQLKQLKADLEAEMAKELLVGVTPSKSKTLA